MAPLHLRAVCLCALLLVAVAFWEPSECIQAKEAKLGANLGRVSLRRALQEGENLLQQIQEADNFLYALRSVIAHGVKNTRRVENELQLLRIQTLQQVRENQARLAQIQYGMRQLASNEPYEEDFAEPLMRNWVVVEATEPSQEPSNWRVVHGLPGASSTRDQPLIAQLTEDKGEQIPESFFLLRSRHQREGFVYSEIYLVEKEPAKFFWKKSDIGHATGIVFKFLSEKKYWTAELNLKKKGEGYVSLSRMDEGDYARMATAPYPIELNRWHQLGVKFDSKGIGVFVDGNHMLQADFISPTPENGSSGLFSRQGKAYYQRFTLGPNHSSFAMAPAGAFGPNPQLALMEVRKLTAEELEGRKKRGSTAAAVAVTPASTTPSPQVNHTVPGPENTTCFEYAPSQTRLEDWIHAGRLQWTAFTEGGEKRISTIGDVSSNDTNQALFLDKFACQSGQYTAKIRVELGSAAGIVFRSYDRINHYTVVLDTSTRTISLHQQIQGAPENLETVRFERLQPQFVTTLEVHDDGEEGMIKVFANDKFLFDHKAPPFPQRGHAGLWVERGQAEFWGFEFEGLQPST